MQAGGDDEDVITGINVTPLVDVCLVLVIIFMVTAPMLSEPMFRVDLPQSRTQEGEEKQKIMVTVSKDGRLAVDDKEVPSTEEFSREIARQLAQHQDGFVVFKADRDAFHGLLVELMQRAKDAGAKSLTIATQKRSR
ncbi:MAG: biopolymer transporter ExbD [Elusimicrobia bacterium]|nr:biopolymer transporter ExbD [Elusimicrobiota bacterium]